MAEAEMRRDEAITGLNLSPFFLLVLSFTSYSASIHESSRTVQSMIRVSPSSADVMGKRLAM